MDISESGSEIPRRFRIAVLVKNGEDQLNELCEKFKDITKSQLGPGSSVGIATDYGLDGPGSKAGEDQIFRPSRPALGPTQPPIQWVPGLSRG